MKKVYFSAVFLLSSCASNLPAYNAANAEFERYANAKIQVKVALLDVSEDKETEDDKKKAIEIWRAIGKECSSNLFNLDSESKSSYESIIKSFQINHYRLNICARNNGLDTFVKAVMPSGREIDFMTYIKEFAHASKDLAYWQVMNDQHIGAQNTSFLQALAYSMSNTYGQANNNIHTVSPYFRGDGVFVMPHIRTNPNKFCFDNLRGCR